MRAMHAVFTPCAGTYVRIGIFVNAIVKRHGQAHTLSRPLFTLPPSLRSLTLDESTSVERFKQVTHVFFEGHGYNCPRPLDAWHDQEDCRMRSPNVWAPDALYRLFASKLSRRALGRVRFLQVEWLVAELMRGPHPGPLLGPEGYEWMARRRYRGLGMSSGRLATMSVVRIFARESHEDVPPSP